MSNRQNNFNHITTAGCKGQHSISDMKHANGEAALVKKPINISSGKEYEKCSYAFFPGCQLGAAEPHIVIKAYNSILFQHPDTAIFLRCCGAPAKLSGSEDTFSETLKVIQDEWEALGKPTLIVACTSCIELLKKKLPEIPMISIYKFFMEYHISGGCNSMDYSLLSSHADTDGGSSDDIIRELAKGMGVKLHPSNDGEYPYITDCIDCRNMLKDSGKDAVHILELIYGMGASNTHMIHRHDHGDSDEHDTSEYSAAELPSYDERLANRTELKETLLALFWNEP